MASPIRLAVDIGGTFTDVALEVGSGAGARTTVTKTLTTHDAEGVTELDVRLAAFMDAAAKDLGAKT